MKRTLVTGSLAFDYIMDFPGSYEEHILPDKIKTLSVSFLVNNLNKNFGGTAGNIAYTLALLKDTVTILASAGKKDFADYKSHLEKTGVDVSNINEVANDFTASAYIMTDKNNCQIAGFYPGAMNSDKNLSLPDNMDFLIVSPTTPLAMATFITQAEQKNIPYLFDPAQALPRLQGETLEAGVDGAEIVIGNDYEIALILEKTGFSKGDLLKKAKVVVTTLGNKGSLIETANEHISIGTAKPENILDPTGAGDAYIAGFVTGYLQQLPLQTCGQIGATAASFAIEKYGTQNHTFTLEQFNDRYKRAFGKEIDLLAK